MSREIKLTGGARIGWVSSSYPFARLTISEEKLSLKSLLGSFSFSPEQVASLQPYGWLLSSGTRIVHTNPAYPETIVFLSLRSPRSVIEQIRRLGFNPSASPESVLSREGFPFQTSFMIAGILVWNALFLVHRWMGTEPGLLAALGLALLLFTSIAVGWSARLQSVVLKPGRHVTEIRSVLLLAQLVGGFLLIGLMIKILAR